MNERKDQEVFEISSSRFFWLRSPRPPHESYIPSLIAYAALSAFAFTAYMLR